MSWGLPSGRRFHVTSSRDPRTAAPAAPNRERALKILSKSIYRELRQNGYEPKQIVALATEIIGLVTTDIKEDDRLD